MNIVLWVLQVLLALAFLAHGWLFLAPSPAIAEQMNATLPRWFQLFLGAAEVLAAVGLTLPGLTRIMPWLVTWAAAGIMIVTASATVFHLIRGEISSAATTLLLLAIAHSLLCGIVRCRLRPARRVEVSRHELDNRPLRFARSSGTKARPHGHLTLALGTRTRQSGRPRSLRDPS